MTDKPRKLDVSRRKLLAGLGTVGIASAGAGLGTTAFLNDTESFTDNVLTAGELNLIVDWYTDVDQGAATPEDDTRSGRMDGDDNEVVYDYEIADVKPGDSGTLAFCPKIVDNPAWLWIGSHDGLTEDPGDTPEPEPTPDEGELAENVHITAVEYASSVAIVDDEIECTVTGTLGYDYPLTFAELATELESGALIDPDYTDDGPTPYPASETVDDQAGPCICIHWEVPTDVGNEIQGDSLSFAFQFVAEQARHNPDGGNVSASPFNASD